MEPSANTPPQIGEHLPALDIPGFSAAEIACYAAAAGDLNKIHVDAAAARSFGLADCVVPGMLLAGQCEIAIFRWRQDASIAAISARFVRPVVAGERLQLQGQIVARSDMALADFILRFIARNEAGKIVCLVDAHVRVG
jgi:acyl dehydratase